MSLLCGYIGQQDDRRLSHMASSARHGGLSSPQYYHFKKLHLAYASDHCSNQLTGIEASKNSLIALAGMPVCKGCKSLSELLSKLQLEGLEILNTLEGSYVGVIYHEESIFLFRDKPGKRTLLYTDTNELSFATETRILTDDATFSPKLRPSSLAQYLAFSYVPGENTMLEGIKELKSGHSLNTHTREQTRYFHPELAKEVRSQDWLSLFRETFLNSIQKSTPAESNQFAVFLSGGIDSSIVTAALAETHGSDRVKAFGIHFGEQYPNELEHIRAVANHTNVKCEEVEINPKSFVPCLHEIVDRLNDPIGDPVTMPNYLLAKHVSAQGYHGVFNGEGGDPLFGGPKNMTMLLHHWYGNHSEKNHREQAYLTSYRRSYEEISSLLTPEWQAKINTEQDLEATLSPYFQTTQPDSFLKKLLLMNMREKGAHLILPKVERMLGAHGLTPLSPLFDESLIELCMQLPGEYLLKNGVEKVILKEAFRGKLPDSIIDRPKSGMRVPVHYWFKGDMKRYAKKILSKKQLENNGIFNAQRVQQLLKYQSSHGKGRYGIKLWMLLTFELWRKQVFGDD